MSAVSMTQTENGVELRIKAVFTRGKSLASYLNRYIYPQYQQAQIDRWKTENQSEGQVWDRLSSAYEKVKKTKFAGYPGGGNALMIATGRLSVAAQGGTGALKLISDDYMVVGIDEGTIPYASYPGVRRPYMNFSNETIKKWTDMISHYVLTGQVAL